MKAYSYKKYGPPNVLHLVDLPKPTPSDDEVLIKVHATTVSSGDWRARSLTLPAGMGLLGRLVFGVFGPRKPVLGTELSGTVESVGKNVTTFKPGDAVFAFPGAGFGAHAEFCIMPANGKIVLMPEGMDFEEAAALSFGGSTAYDFLVNKAQLKAGESVLINGASGSTGLAFVQLAKHFGAEVTAVNSGENADLVRSVGADHVVDYKSEDFTNAGPVYDMVIDTVGTAGWSRSKKALKRGGRLVIVSGSLVDMVFGPLRARLAGRRLIGGVASEKVELLQKIAELAGKGAYRPVIDRTYDFGQMVDAHRYVDSGRKKGNVVIAVTKEAA